MKLPRTERGVKREKEGRGRDSGSPREILRCADAFPVCAERRRRRRRRR